MLTTHAWILVWLTLRPTTCVSFFFFHSESCMRLIFEIFCVNKHSLRKVTSWKVSCARRKKQSLSWYFISTLYILLLMLFFFSLMPITIISSCFSIPFPDLLVSFLLETHVFTYPAKLSAIQGNWLCDERVLGLLEFLAFALIIILSFYSHLFFLFLSQYLFCGHSIIINVFLALMSIRLSSGWFA